MALAFGICAGSGVVFPNLRPLAYATTGGGSSTLTTSNAANEEPASGKIFGEVSDISPAPEGGEGTDGPDGQKPAVGDSGETGNQQSAGNGEETPETQQPSNPENQPQGELGSTDDKTGEIVDGAETIATAPKFAAATAPLAASTDTADDGISTQADATAGDFTITGGMAGVDYSFSSNVLHILTSTPLTIANTTPATATSHSIQVDAGVYANLTFNNVNISAKIPLEI